MESLIDLGVAEAAAAIREGAVKAEAFAEALLQQARAADGLNAISAMSVVEVREAARAADRARAAGEPLGALHGVPISFKDNINVVGLPNTGGTPALSRHFPQRNAPVVDAILGAGAICLGKTGMHELAFGMTSNNGAFGPVRNPYDPALIAGGSSGGAAAGVAARICPAGIGTDTGGSVRAPAAFCGVAGFRPSVGRWSQTGIVPISATRDTPGPIARSVGDLALIDAVVTGAPIGLDEMPLAGLRIGVPRPYFWEDLDPEVERAAQAALQAMRDAGAILLDAELPQVAALEAAVGFPVALYEVKRDLTLYLRDQGLDLDFERVAKRVASPDVKSIVESLLGDGAVPEEAYLAALNVERPKLVEAYRRYFTVFDAMVFPTTPIVACPVGHDTTIVHNGRDVPTFATVGRNTGPSSNAGIPGISMPIGFTRAGLPIGLEFDAGVNQDRRLLSICLSLEKLFPPLSAPTPRVAN